MYVTIESYGRLPVHFRKKPLRVLCHVMNDRCFFPLYIFSKYALMMDNYWTDMITRIQKYILTWLIVDLLSSNTIVIQTCHDNGMTTDCAFRYRLKLRCYLKKSVNEKQISIGRYQQNSKDNILFFQFVVYIFGLYESFSYINYSLLFSK